MKKRVTIMMAGFLFCFCTSILFITPLNAQPFQSRILIATSTDGLNWTKAGKIFNDSADVPDALVTPEGKVYVYFQGLETKIKDVIMVSISDNGLDNWHTYVIKIRVR